MEEIIQIILKSYGLVGIVLLAPYAGIFFLWKELKKTLQEKAKDSKAHAEAISSYGERIVEAHKLRVQDAQSISDRLIALSSEHSSLSKETNMALDRLGDLMTLVRERR